MNTWRLLIASILLLIFLATANAGIRGPGKYCGVVIFDRWDSCTLYSGIYVMYVSESVKEQLRDHAGQCIQIDATEVNQPINPGDGLIKKFKFLGPAPAMPEWESPEGVKLSITRAFEDGHAPEFVICAENVSDRRLALHMGALAPTLLGQLGKDRRFFPADGKSEAIVTRQSFFIGSDEKARMNPGGGDYQMSVESPKTLSRKVDLEPKTKFEIRLSMKLPPGQYEFLAGYGGGTHGGQCAASNLIGFDVNADGVAVVVERK